MSLRQFSLRINFVNSPAKAGTSRGFGTSPSPLPSTLFFYTCRAAIGPRWHGLIKKQALRICQCCTWCRFWTKAKPILFDPTSALSVHLF